MRMELRDRGLVLSTPEIPGEPSEAVRRERGENGLRRPILFRLAGKEWGEKGRWDAFGACCGYNSSKNLICRYYKHTYSPYGRYGTRRLLRYIKFDGSCV